MTATTRIKKRGQRVDPSTEIKARELKAAGATVRAIARELDLGIGTVSAITRDVLVLPETPPVQPADSSGTQADTEPELPVAEPPSDVQTQVSNFPDVVQKFYRLLVGYRVAPSDGVVICDYLSSLEPGIFENPSHLLGALRTTLLNPARSRIILIHWCNSMGLPVPPSLLGQEATGQIGPAGTLPPGGRRFIIVDGRPVPAPADWDSESYGFGEALRICEVERGRGDGSSEEIVELRKMLEAMKDAATERRFDELKNMIATQHVSSMSAFDLMARVVDKGERLVSRFALEAGDFIERQGQQNMVREAILLGISTEEYECLLSGTIPPLPRDIRMKIIGLKLKADSETGLTPDEKMQLVELEQLGQTHAAEWAERRQVLLTRLAHGSKMASQRGEDILTLTSTSRKVRCPDCKQIGLIDTSDPELLRSKLGKCGACGATLSLAPVLSSEEPRPGGVDVIRVQHAEIIAPAGPTRTDCFLSKGDGSFDCGNFNGSPRCEACGAIPHNPL